MLRIGVCDDDKAFLGRFGKAVTGALERRGLTADISCFSDSAMLLEIHRAEPFGAVFLDIDMPTVNGFAAARAIAEAAPDCCIIFVTCHNELVYDSFDFRPLNFIVKQEQTLMLPKLERVVDQLCSVLSDNERIVLEDREQGRFSVRLSDIVYIESADHDVLFHTRDTASPVRARGKLSAFEEEYSSRGFVRVHKKYLVNLRAVFNIELTQERVLLKTGGSLPMGRHYKAETDRRLTEFLRKG
ncbi:MAG: response regulator transcription factor [Ruminococcus sp.]|nr:response regulator transcription factor [Ruminococcus sp.]MBR1764736.1 response regulator transcription factor [Ruminococcus sp.]